jgi:hypothetical protein
MPEPIFMKLGAYIMAFHSHLNGVIYISPLSVLPVLQPLKFLRENPDIAGRPTSIFIKHKPS